MGISRVNKSECLPQMRAKTVYRSTAKTNIMIMGVGQQLKLSCIYSTDKCLDERYWVKVKGEITDKMGKVCLVTGHHGSLLNHSCSLGSEVSCFKYVRSMAYIYTLQRESCVLLKELELGSSEPRSQVPSTDIYFVLTWQDPRQLLSYLYTTFLYNRNIMSLPCSSTLLGSSCPYANALHPANKLTQTWN